MWALDLEYIPGNPSTGPVPPLCSLCLFINTILAEQPSNEKCKPLPKVSVGAIFVFFWLAQTWTSVWFGEEWGYEPERAAGSHRSRRTVPQISRRRRWSGNIGRCPARGRRNGRWWSGPLAAGRSCLFPPSSLAGRPSCPVWTSCSSAAAISLFSAPAERLLSSFFCWFFFRFSRVLASLARGPTANSVAATAGHTTVLVNVRCY